MTTMQIRVDDDLKAQAEAVFADIGLDTSSAIRLFLKQTVNEGTLPFPIRPDPWKRYVHNALLEAEEQARSTDKRLTHEEVMSAAWEIVHGK